MTDGQDSAASYGAASQGADQYHAQPEAMRATVGNVGGILVQAITALLDLESSAVDPGSFATLGGAVASANNELQGQQTRALRSLLDLLRQTNDSVHRSANDYDDADRDVAASYGGGGATTQSPLWHPTFAADLAGHAVHDSAGAPGEPYSVHNVLDYLSRAGMGELAYRPVTDVAFADANGFADWLDADPDHQSRIGVIGVYSGHVPGLADVPGIQRGDLVVADPSGPPGAAGAVIGVAGGDGQLYNRGPVGVDLTYGGDIRVYRPLHLPAA
ncbi:MAG: WXG100 family type VII secretion target [Actinocatenispora sp.]